jgi:hypothetical protein
MVKSTISDSAIRRLTAHQRDLLIDHIDGPVDVSVHNVHTVQCRNALIAYGLLRGTPTNVPTARPRHTALTERGRMAVAIVLGDYADGLIRAGLLEQENPLEVLQRLKADGRLEPKRPGDLAAIMREDAAALRMRRS